MKALRSSFVHPLLPPAGLLSLEVGLLVLFGRAFDSAGLTGLEANDAHIMATKAVTAGESAPYAGGVRERLLCTFPIVDEQGHRDVWRCGRG